MPSEVFTDKAFFECTQCGQCCKGFGGTYVTQADLQAIADYVGQSVEVVRRDCCASSGSRLVLAQRRDGYCVFWEGNCTIHPVKPRMCRQWPFILGLVADPGNWFVMADECPGMQRNIKLEDLEAFLRENPP